MNMNEEFQLRNRLIRIQSIVPIDIKNIENKENFVESVGVDYIIVCPNAVDGEGNPTTLNLGVQDTINVADYKSNEFIPFNELSQNYFYNLAKEHASSSQNMQKMLDYVDELDKEKETIPNTNKSNTFRFFKK